MATRRERLERKVEKRGEWADKARERSAAAFDAAGKRAEAIPFGQPILVGHHSERRDRNYRARIHAGMDRGLAEDRKAKHHESKASGLAIALERSIFDDDPDAIEQLEAKVAELEAARELMKQANAVFKKRGREGVAELLGVERAAEVFRRASYTAVARPFPAYALSNSGAEVRRCKQRIELIRKRRQRAAEAEAAGGVWVVRHPAGGSLVSARAVVTFAERPDRSVIVALREAGYHWGQGSWHGLLAKLPAAVVELEEDAALVAGHAVAAEVNPNAYAGALEADAELERGAEHPMAGVRCGELTADAQGVWRGPEATAKAS